MKYVTTRCPNCNKILRNHDAFPHTSGCPIKICPHCGQSYIDTYCTEPAFKDYKAEDKSSIFGKLLSACILRAIVCGGLLACFLDGKICIILGVIIFIIWFAYSYTKNCKTIDSDNEKERILWEASDQRLKNPEYARKLKDAGFPVPSRYL